jgi:hypothetical protein
VDTFVFDDGLDIPTLTLRYCVLDTTNDPTAIGEVGSGHFNGFLIGLFARFTPPPDTLLPLGSWTKIGDLYLKINLDPGIERIVPDAFDIVIDSVFYPPAGYFKFTPRGGDSFQPDVDSGRVHVTVGSPWDAEEQNADVITPHSYELAQNYPNPFNPSTTIRFYLSGRGVVDLAVYNILGRKVATLVESDVDAGWQEVIWDGTSSSGDKVASGIYFYRLTSGEFIETKKMLLLK